MKQTALQAYSLNRCKIKTAVIVTAQIGLLPVILGGKRNEKNFIDWKTEQCGERNQ